MTTLYALNYLSELIELLYDAGQFTRKRIIPALIMVYVALEIAYLSIRTRRLPNEVKNWLTKQPPVVAEEPKLEEVKEPAKAPKRRRRRATKAKVAMA